MEEIAIGDRGFMAFASVFNNFLMVHVRKFHQQKPTKFGIALTTKEWDTLIASAKKIDDQFIEMTKMHIEEEKMSGSAGQKFVPELVPIGSRSIFAFVSKFKNTFRIHIRKFEDGLPTGKGIALNPIEWLKLQDYCEEINELIANKKNDLKKELKKRFRVKAESAEPPKKKHCLHEC